MDGYILVELLKILYYNQDNRGENVQKLIRCVLERKAVDKEKAEDKVLLGKHEKFRKKRQRTKEIKV